MADALWMRIREVEWGDYPTADGASMPNLLKNLASRKLPRAMKASQQIWASVCGGGRIHPVAKPSIPFLIEIFEIADAAVQDGIIDIFQSITADEEGPFFSQLKEYKGQLSRELQCINDDVTAAKLNDLLVKL